MTDQMLPPEGTAYTRTLRRAAHTVGGVEQLAEMLQVSAADMARWIVGDGRPPQHIFLAALDIVSGAGLEDRARQSQDAADRAQRGADRAQGSADRAQGSADRAQARRPASRRCRSRPGEKSRRAAPRHERRRAAAGVEPARLKE